MKISLWCALILLSTMPAHSQATKPPSPCAEAVAREFDFWIGDWKVSTQGKPVGTNHVERILDGCALIENWSGLKGGEGKSLNFYDRDDGLWHQTWIDRSGGALFLSGKFENGAMRLEGVRASSAKQPAARHRITWTPLSGGKVRQLWESSPLDKDQWTTQFDGLYEPAN
jgi:hypothetical protein